MKDLKFLENKHVVLLFGTTGSGKTTLANAILYGSEILKKNELGLIDVVDETQVKFKIGHKVVSETKTPKYAAISE